MRTLRKDNNSRKVTPKPQKHVELRSKSFRVNARKFMLTYSQVPEGLTLESAILQLQKKTGIKDYVIGDEDHEDGGRHFHVILISDRKVDIRSASKFDIEFEGNTYKCRCEGVTDLPGRVAYVCQDKLYQTSLKHIQDGVLMPLERLLPSMSKSEGIDKTLEFYKDNFSALAMGGKSLSNVEKFLELVSEVERRNEAAMDAKAISPFKVDTGNDKVAAGSISTTLIPYWQTWLW